MNTYPRLPLSQKNAGERIQRHWSINNWFSRSHFLATSPSLLITAPSASKDLLMFAPSFSRWPDVPVDFCSSEPARSTKFRYATVFTLKSSCERTEASGDVSDKPVFFAPQTTYIGTMQN